MSSITCILALLTIAAACGLPHGFEKRELTKRAIKNVHVGNGNSFSTDLSTVVFINGKLSNATALGTSVVDEKQGYGITTAFDMNTFPISSVDACRAFSHAGVTDIRTPRAAGTVNGMLIIMQSIVKNTGAPSAAYTFNAHVSVANMYNARVPILVGSDANLNPHVPANPPFGLSLHEELQPLVQAGVSPVDTIRSATSPAANMFRLYDRSSIQPGLRADLVLLSADPSVDIRNSLAIEKV
ncbi:hypothetical protein BJY01DRAFT_251982 [Aspergillus pseudoustus]|uniref:Amidohydrolase-related domain-containing protein n=1 Tax=Aspergillus pseudoustus TaxID=1810923 RepID=A0ABR4J8P3_9EURO